jgi:diguanylate cyclase (GGDEF)-like protein
MRRLAAGGRNSNDGVMPSNEDLLAEMDYPARAGPICDFVDEEIARLRHNHFRSLDFVEVVEERFEHDTAKERSHRLWFEGLLAIIIFNGCLLADYLLVKDVKLESIVRRTVVITPIALIVNYMMRLNPKRWLREGSVAVGTTLICFLNLHAENSNTAATTTFGMMSVLITVLFAGIVMRLRLPYMTSSTVAMLGGGLWFASHATGLMGSEKVIGISMMTLGVAVTLTAGYSLERQERLAYLLFLRSELQGEALHRLSNLDKLTDLPNRRAFEEQFERLWMEGIQTMTSLSAIVIDIDHFKEVNDLYGHLYGDDVLRRVGGLLTQALHVQNDFVARFGGEEFVILLPNTNMESALLVAERVRTMVEMAGTPASEHLNGRPTMLVRVSCGVSACVPDRGVSRERLLKIADRALYKAKENGRNRVESRRCELSSGVHGEHGWKDLAR